MKSGAILATGVNQHNKGWKHANKAPEPVPLHHSFFSCSSSWQAYLLHRALCLLALALILVPLT